MTNEERRRIVNQAKLDGYQGSYVDLFKQGPQNPEGMNYATTPEQKEQGLRPLHEAGRTDASMTFPDVPPNTPFNTVGMKRPIDIKKYDKQGHLVKSYESVPPGIQNLDTGPNEGTVLETPARMQYGGYNPGEYMNEMQPKVFPNQKRDAKWVNYATEHDFAGRFPGETRTNEQIGLERSNRNTVPLPPTPTVPKELRVRAQEGATRQDSLDLYNNAVSLEQALKKQGYNIFRNSFPTTGEWKGATDKEKKQYAENVKDFYGESFGNQKYKDDYDAWVASGDWKKYGIDNPPSYNWWMGRNTIEPVDENRVRTREMSATSLNMDLPTQLLDSRISPQGFAIAHKTFKQFNPNEHNLVRGYTDATDEKRLRPHSENDMYDPTEFVTQYGDTIKDANRQGAEDQLQHLISMHERYSDQEHVRPIPSDSKITTEIRYDIDDLVSFPYYDPLMIKPYDMLTDAEKAKRVKRKTKIEKTLTASNQNETTPQRPRVTIPETMTPLDVGRTQTPKKDIIIKQYGSQPTGRKPELIMRSNQRMRTGQEPNYYKVWDEKRKQWSTRPVEPEELDRYQRENKVVEPIITPAISFQKGGPKAEEGDPTEDKPVLDAFMMEKFMADKKGGDPETWRAVADTIGYHESGPWGRMDPKATQVPSGIGRGIFQFETTHSESFKTAKQRHRNVAKAMGVKPDPGILKANNADELSREQQYLLFYGNMYESPAKLSDYTSGNLPLVDLWLQSHKRKEAEGDRKAFESSRLDAKRNLRNYPSIGIAPNTTASVDATRTVSPQLQRAFDILKKDN